MCALTRIEMTINGIYLVGERLCRKILRNDFYRNLENRIHRGARGRMSKKATYQTQTAWRESLPLSSIRCLPESILRTT